VLENVTISVLSTVSQPGCYNIAGVFELGVVIGILLGVATGWIAQSKGRNFFGWFLLGAFLPLVGLVMAAAISPIEENVDRRQIARGGRKACPYCAELIRQEARVCRYCGRDLPSPTAMDPDLAASTEADRIQIAYVDRTQSRGWLADLLDPPERDH
jgi:hypothetical protein